MMNTSTTLDSFFSFFYTTSNLIQEINIFKIIIISFQNFSHPAPPNSFYGHSIFFSLREQNEKNEENLCCKQQKSNKKVFSSSNDFAQSQKFFCTRIVAVPSAVCVCLRKLYRNKKNIFIKSRK